MSGLQSDYLGITTDLEAEVLPSFGGHVHLQPQALADGENGRSPQKGASITDIASVGSYKGGVVRLRRLFFNPNGNIDQAPQGDPTIRRGGAFAHALTIRNGGIILIVIIRLSLESTRSRVPKPPRHSHVRTQRTSPLEHIIVVVNSPAGSGRT
jgi:hypothetical protein